MNVGQAKQTARDWIAANVEQWPGLRAAHLVGGITTMPADAPFPLAKDVDLHLIFDEGSPALQTTGPFDGLLEVAYGGLSLEAGIKPITEYASPEVVLGNPEIAHHLLLDCLLYDPDGLLRDLQAPIEQEYSRRRWVRARLDHERNGLAGVMAMRPMVAATWGASGEVNILGYSTTFLSAALSVATLNAPKMGGRMFLRLSENLSAYDRLDLYEELLPIFGLNQTDPDRVANLLREGIEAFDLAVTLPMAPGPFRHKLRPHLRPYFVESCRSMLAEGHYRESLAWLVPYYLTTTDVITEVGNDADRPKFAARQAAFLRELGLDTTEARAIAFERFGRVSERIFALADEIVAHHPDIVD